MLKKSFITGTSTLQPLYLLYIHAILIPNCGLMQTNQNSKPLFIEEEINKAKYPCERSVTKKGGDFEENKRLFETTL